MDDSAGTTPGPSLQGKTALVTGAGRSVGAGIAVELAARGAMVAVNDLHPDRADGLAQSLTDAGRSARGCAFDVTDDAAVDRAVDGLLGEHGRIDILVHNAGVLDGGGRPHRVADMPLADLRLQVELNLCAFFHLAQRVLPGQADAGWGRIVQISSGASSTGLPIGVSAYGAAKAGGEALVRHIGVEYGPAGITANTLALGLMENVGDAASPAVQKMLRAVPVRRTGSPDDVAAAVAWLCSPQGGFVNGQVIHLNGGTVFGR